MDYWQLRDIVKELVPRQMLLLPPEPAGRSLVNEKGRKRNYSQFDLLSGQMERKERLLNTEGLNSFVEVSCRAAECPMPLNLDVWDGFACVARGEPVLTEGGIKPIENLVVGDIVYSVDENTLQLTKSTVSGTHSSLRKDMIEIVTDTGQLLVTSDHPVFTKRGWILAQDLLITDELLRLV